MLGWAMPRLALMALLLALMPLAEAAAEPIIIAHRGRDATTPENTLAAFRHSIDRGITILEVDVRRTKDDELVLLHDETLDRTTNGTGRIAELTLAEAQALDAGQGERIPTLRESLRFVADAGTSLLLDIKPGTPIDDVLALVRHEKAESRSIFGIRSPSQAAKLRALAPKLRVVALMPRLQDLEVFEAAGVSTVRLWSHWIDPQVGGDPSLVAKVKARGHSVWCVVGKRLPRSEAESRATHQRLSALGVDALVTDRPDRIQQTTQ